MFKTSKERTLAAATLLGVAFVFFQIGLHRGEVNTRTAYQTASLENTELYKPESVDFSAFWTAWNILNEKYVSASTTEVVTDQEKVWGAIQGLAASLGDPYTVFFPPVESEIFESDVRGNFEGVGMEVGTRDGILTVVSPLKGTPADRAGVRAGDRIIEIDDVSTENLDTDQAVQRIRGPRGTAVRFLVLREGEPEPLELSVIRDVINIPTIETELLPSGIFVIELYNFSATSPGLFQRALREFVLSGSDKLILDLRGNPGGYLEAAIGMASWFLPPGEVIVREDFGENKDSEVYRSQGLDIFNDNLKMVILVDRGSASASEILAGALQEYGIAKVIGGKTFGKGSVQELLRITNDTSLKVTVAQWLTPNGVSISDGGITPDYEVGRTREDFEANRDPQKEKAIEVLLSWPQ